MNLNENPLSPGWNTRPRPKPECEIHDLSHSHWFWNEQAKLICLEILLPLSLAREKYNSTFCWFGVQSSDILWLMGHACTAGLMLLHLTVHHHHENVFGVGHYPRRKMRAHKALLNCPSPWLQVVPTKISQSHPARPNLDQLTSTNPQMKS